LVEDSDKHGDNTYGYQHTDNPHHHVFALLFLFLLVSLTLRIVLFTHDIITSPDPSEGEERPADLWGEAGWWLLLLFKVLSLLI
jgi:hypothetical protein